MAYSGKYRVRNRDKYKGNPDNIVFRSMWEAHTFKWCDENPNVKKWSSEEFFIPYFYEADKKWHRYFVDLKITFNDGRTLIVEIKPDKETKPPKRPDKSKRYINESLTYVKNMNKWKAADRYAKDNNYEFQIWTEKTLQKMKILPMLKPLGKLQPLAPFRKKSKKSYK